MSPTISRVAVIGAGTIGASWAAYFLARGCEVNVTDPFREADAIRRAVAGLWPVLERAGLSPGATLERLRVVADPGSAVRDVGFRAGERSGRRSREDRSLRTLGCGCSRRNAHCIELVWTLDESHSIPLQTSATLRHRTSVQSAPSDAAGRSRRRRSNRRSCDCRNDRVLPGASVSIRYTSAKRSVDTLPTGCKPRCGGKRFT